MNIMARYPAERKPETRARIIEAAERLIKERGPQGASVEAVMREAGLTVGGFYAHFVSKEALVDEALLAGLERSLERMLQGLDDASPQRFARELIRRYLRQACEPDLRYACPLTLLLPEVARSDEAYRRTFAERTARLVERVESRLPLVPGMAPRDVALALYAALAGAVAFARAAATTRGRDRILAATQASLARWLGLDDASDDARGP
jgi:TetR/AcrR family transcriptional repressor of nem operon